MHTNNAHDHIRQKAGIDQLDIALILGSGLSAVADLIDGISIDYAELAGFHVGGVSGHRPTMKVGTYGTLKVAILGGRSHYYEQGVADVMRQPLETLKDLNVKQLVLTNSAGSLLGDIGPGSLMLLDDHINFSGLNPLIGETTDKRFVDMTVAYDSDIRSDIALAAGAADISLHPGVYAWFSGPSFETPAEIRAARILGATAVGMSTVPEVILARFLGIPVAAISAITNFGAGMADEHLSHEHTKKGAALAAENLTKLIKTYLDHQSDRHGGRSK
ncbi:Purine nucleoside phosphorylase 2 [Agrobacterium sp. DSM 25558]|uniref:purine-nucleoside phosphorylase n=1 Tax=Agrobacterium sp. DSM 25558 TaxID=1907665 RepID=UPI00097249BF|nr:purine-nucleoside phosphorylase [Agrobacterium sp. DSM 25558]SCX30127.1 Purine nucleoside phosphorylase 2 [Agrobacterium sp. DSM 25558]